MFRPASDVAFSEVESRRNLLAKVLRFGVDFLDDALVGILPGDLVLIGAPTGIGKTQLCCHIALANLEIGKTVHYIALEAEEFEIERRLKYQVLSQRFFADANRPKLSRHLSYDHWKLGTFLEPLAEYEAWAGEYCSKAYRDLHVYQKRGKFTAEDLIEQVIIHSDKTDLIIVDHVHYFDFDDDNENRAIKKIAATARDLTISEGRPMVLVAHLRKRDRFNDELAASLDEFHGSSDLSKIATKAITVSPGKPLNDGTYETFFRTPKNRDNGSSSRYMGRVAYSLKRGMYEPGYKLGWSEQSRKNGFAEIDHGIYPEWAKRSGTGGSNIHRLPERIQTSAPPPRGPAANETLHQNHLWD